MITIYHTTVFANSPGGGNPCPVILNADDLSLEQGKALAKKFNAETILVLNSANPEADIRLRYFVPRYEMEMCVHGTIAAVSVLQQHGVFNRPFLKIETPLGIIPVELRKSDTGVSQVTVYQFAPKFSERNPSPEEICSALKISETAIDFTMGSIQSVSASRFKLMVPLKSKKVLNEMAPDYPKLWNVCGNYRTTGVYVFTKCASGGNHSFCARQFPWNAGYPEDPATGVAAAALAGYLGHYLFRNNGWMTVSILQGEAMGRPSRLTAGAFRENGKLTRSKITGTAAIIGEESFAAI